MRNTSLEEELQIGESLCLHNGWRQHGTDAVIERIQLL